MGSEGCGTLDLLQFLGGRDVLLPPRPSWFPFDRTDLRRDVARFVLHYIVDTLMTLDTSSSPRT